MGDTLKDQLLALGFKAPPKAAPAQPSAGAQMPSNGASRGASRGEPRKGEQRKGEQRKGEQRKGEPPRTREPDLAQAWAARARTEREERERVRREAEELARARRELRQRLQAVLEGKAVNDASADVARHFPHGGKIRRVYVTSAQLPQLNRGELGVVQHMGRFVLVERAVALAAADVAPDCLVLLPDPDAVADDGVPADLVW